MTPREQLDSSDAHHPASSSGQAPAGGDGVRFEAVAAQARDLARRLEGSSVARMIVVAGDSRIEIERGVPQGTTMPAIREGSAEAGQPVASGAGPGLGVAPEARTASGSFAAITDADQRAPVLAPLVGTFYRSPRPGAKVFVEEGDVVEIGQTVCIVEAMKMMNEVAAGEAGRVVEIVVADGEPVEFEQVLMYLERVGD